MFEKKQNINYLIEKLLEFYELLENYIWKHNQVNLSIQIEESQNNLKIKLLKEETILDYLELNFNEKERKLYEYIILSYLYNIFKNVMVFKNNNKIYNKIQKPYLTFTIEDNIILRESEVLLKLINTNQKTKINELLENKYLETKKKNRVIKNDIKQILEQRVIITKRLLRSGIHG